MSRNSSHFKLTSIFTKDLSYVIEYYFKWSIKILGTYLIVYVLL